MKLIGPIRRGEKWGYVSETGEVTIPFEFMHIGVFHEGLAWFTRGEKLGYINELGQVAIEPQFELGDRGDPSSDFHSGRALVRMNHDDGYGYIDHSGELIIPYGFGYASEFVEGIAIVSDAAEGRVVIDLFGNRLGRIPYQLASDIPYAANRIKVFLRCGPHRAPAFVDRFGEIAVGPLSDLTDIGGFSNDWPFYAPVTQQTTRRCGYFNNAFELAIPHTYLSCRGFSEGCGAVAVNGLKECPAFKGLGFGYIDGKGDWVIPPSYKNAGPFKCGTAAVDCATKWRTHEWVVIDKANKVLTSTNYDEIRDLDHGFRLCQKGRLDVLLNPRCEPIWEFRGNWRPED